MARALKGVEALPELRVQALLPGSWVDNADPDDDAPMTERPSKRRSASALLALIGGQIALHSCMAGMRMAAPLPRCAKATRRGRSACCSACSRRRRSCSRSPPGASPTATATTCRCGSRSR